MAIREALDRQAIEAPPRLPALAQFAWIGRWLEQLRQRLAVQGDPDQPPIALVLVESRLWTRYSMHDGKLSLAPHVPGAVGGDIIVLTGASVLKGLLDGSISAQTAISDGILVVTGASYSAAHVEERLRRAFEGAARTNDHSEAE